VFGLFACHAPAPSAWASARLRALLLLMMSDSLCVSVFADVFSFVCLPYVDPIADMCVNAPPTRLPNLVPFALTQPIMFTARLDALPVSFRLA
jgi:hypothetical protein